MLRPKVFLCLIVSLALLLGGGFQAARAADGVRVTAIRGNLYFHREAKFSLDDIFSGKVPLWNTFRNSNAILVLVDLEGSALDGLTKGAITVSVRTEGRMLGHQRFNLTDFYGGKEQRVTLPMLVHAAVCTPVIAEVVLDSGGKKQTLRSGAAPFACGE